MFDIERARVRYDDLHAAVSDTEREDLVEQTCRTLCRGLGLPAAEARRPPRLAEIRDALEAAAAELKYALTLELQDRAAALCPDLHLSRYASPTADSMEKAKLEYNTYVDDQFESTIQLDNPQERRERAISFAAEAYTRIVLLQPFVQGNVLVAECATQCLLIYLGLLKPLHVGANRYTPLTDQVKRRLTLEAAFAGAAAGELSFLETEIRIGVIGKQYRRGVNSVLA